MDFTEIVAHEYLMIMMDVVSRTLLPIIILLSLKLRSSIKFIIISLCVCDLYTSIVDIPILEKQWLENNEGRELLHNALLSYIGVIVPVIRLWLVASLCLHFLFRVRGRAHLETLGLFILILGIAVCFWLTNYRQLRYKEHFVHHNPPETVRCILILVPEATVIIVFLLDIILYFTRRKTLVYKEDMIMYRWHKHPRFPRHILIVGLLTVFIHLPVRLCLIICTRSHTCPLNGAMIILERIRILAMAVSWIMSRQVRNMLNVVVFKRMKCRPMTKSDDLHSSSELFKALISQYSVESKDNVI